MKRHGEGQAGTQVPLLIICPSRGRDLARSRGISAPLCAEAARARCCVASARLKTDCPFPFRRPSLQDALNLNPSTATTLAHVRINGNQPAHPSSARQLETVSFKKRKNLKSNTIKRQRLLFRSYGAEI